MFASFSTNAITDCGSGDYLLIEAPAFIGSSNFCIILIISELDVYLLRVSRPN